MIDKIKNLLKKRVVKDYFAVVSANLLLQPLQILKGFVVAKFLGPEHFGLLKSVELITMLNKFGSLGFNAVASREIPHAMGENDLNTESKIRNTNYTAELILSIILFLIGSFSAVFVIDQIVAILVFLASSALLLTKIQGIYLTESGIQKEFKLSSRITLYNGIALTIITIILVPFLKIYAIFLTNIVVLLISIFQYRKFIHFKYKFEIDKLTLLNSMRIGLPLVVATLTLGGYKYAERLLILNFLDSKALGLFSFGIMVSNEISILFKASIKVRLQDIYLLTGSKQFLKVHRMVLKETFILTISSIFLIPIIWIGLEIFVPLLLDKYTTAIPAGKILSLSIPFLVVSNYAGAVTTSKLINKIYFPITTRIISIIIFAAGTFLLFQYNALSLVTYSILNVVGYAFYNLAILFNYYYSFYKKYVNIT